MNDKIWVCDDEPSQRFPVFTRGNVGEVFVDAVSPLTWSAFGRHAWEPGWRDAFCGIGAFRPDEFKPSGQPEITACFGGYIYINMSVTRVLAVRIPGMTVEAIDRSLFGDYPDVPPYRADPRDESAERTAAVSGWLQSLFTDDPLPVNAGNRERILARQASRPDLPSLSDADLVARFRDLIPEARRLFERHVRNGYGANVLVGLLEQICAAAGAADLASSLTAAVGEVDSADPAFELWALSRVIRNASAVSAAFDDGAEGLLARLASNPAPDVRDFLDRWRSFLDRWGFLGTSVWDLRSPTYRTHPELVLRMLERMRRSPDTASPALRTGELTARREAAIETLSARLASNPAVQGQFVAAARAAAGHLAARERGKTNCTRWNEEARACMRELGLRFVRRGTLARWEHILMLMLDELDGFVADPTPFMAVIAERAERLSWLERKEPPFVFEGAAPPLSRFRDRGTAPPGTAAAGTQLQGLGVSPGRVTGRARIVPSLEVDSELEPGEIIVTGITDASWGPLFLAAAGVVVETGAAVSHAAIVSREIGIPAVVSVTDAMRRIPPGCTLTVDGNTGTVTIG